METIFERVYSSVIPTPDGLMKLHEAVFDTMISTSIAIDLYSELVNMVYNPKIVFDVRDLGDDQVDIINKYIKSINQSLTVSISTLVSILKSTDISIDSFDNKLKDILNSKGLGLISYSDIMITLQQYANHIRVDKGISDFRGGAFDISYFVKQNPIYTAGTLLSPDRVLVTQSLFGMNIKSIIAISKIRDYKDNADEVIIKGFISVMMVSTYLGYDVINLVDILNVIGNEEITL